MTARPPAPNGCRWQDVYLAAGRPVDGLWCHGAAAARIEVEMRS
jgi:hypothetical protein